MNEFFLILQKPTNQFVIELRDVSMAKDRIHKRVRKILEDNNFNVFKDPLFLEFANTTIRADLAIETFIQSTGETKRIVIEIKSFSSKSLIQAARNAVGQVLMYESALEQRNIDMPVYLTIPITKYNDMGTFGSYLPFIEKYCNTMIYNTNTGVILEWKQKHS